MSRYLIEQLQGKQNIRVALHSEVQSLYGEKTLTGIDLVDRQTGAVERVDSGGVFVFIGADAETRWMPEAIARDEHGYVCTGEAAAKSGRWNLERDPYLLETCVPGIFACGDVRSSPIKRVAAAVGEGSMTIAFVHQYLAHAG
jgi:thioredoxin reductase (NADPH)